MVAHVAVAHSIGSTILHKTAVCCRYVVGMWWNITVSRQPWRETLLWIPVLVEWVMHFTYCCLWWLWWLCRWQWWGSFRMYRRYVCSCNTYSETTVDNVWLLERWNGCTLSWLSHGVVEPVLQWWWCVEVDCMVRVSEDCAPPFSWSILLSQQNRICITKKGDV